MAEEEILQQAAPAKKKKGGGGGGVSFVQVIVIAVVLIILTAISTMVIKGMLGTGMEGLTKEVKAVGDQKYSGDVINVKDRIPFTECSSIAKLQERPLIVNLADGVHYLSTEISVCLNADYKAEGKKKVEDVFMENKEKVLYTCNEYLSTLTMATLFPGGGAPVAKKVETGPGELSLEGDTNTAPDFSRRMDQVRGELLRVLQKRGLTFVKDVYFTSFLVQ